MTNATDLTALQAHIDAQNVGRTTFVIAPAEHFLEFYGISTVEDYEYHMAVATFSDTYKDVHGFRPHNIGEMTTVDLYEATDLLFDQLEEVLETEYLTDDEIAEKDKKLEAEALATLSPPPSSTAMGDAMRIALG